MTFLGADPNAPPRVLLVLVAAAVLLGIAAGVWFFNSIS